MHRNNHNKIKAMININKNAYIDMALGQLLIKMHLMYMG
jgi:hypothetical protein